MPKDTYNNPAKSVKIHGPGEGYKTDKEDYKLLTKEAKALRQMLKDCNAYNKWAKRHDDVNLVELYMDCKSDLAFIAFWCMPHSQWMKKYR